MTDTVLAIQDIIGSQWWITIQMLYLMGKFADSSCVFLPVSFEPIEEKDYKQQTEIASISTLTWYCGEKCEFQTPLIMSSEEFLKYLKECIDNYSQRLSVIPLKLLSRKGFGHANMLIYDKLNNTLERFEPHGQESFIEFNPKLLDASLPLFFEKNIIGKPIKYFPPKSFCPIEGPQLLEEIARKKLGISFKPGKGLCSVWSFIYANYRLSFPDKTRNEIIQDITSKIPTDKTIYHNVESIILMLWELSEQLRKAKTSEQIKTVITNAVTNIKIE